jgi:hypothetical protein
MRRTLSFRRRISPIAEPGRGVAAASFGLILLIMFFDALGSLVTLRYDSGEARAIAAVSVGNPPYAEGSRP